MSISIKKTVSAVLAVIIAAVIMFGVFPAADASALDMIQYKITYSGEYAKLTLTPAKSTNEIRYTAGGAKPTKSSKLYTVTLRTKKAVVIRAAEYDKNGTKVASIKLTLAPRAAAPVVSESSGKLTVTSSTSGAKIYYTTDGSIPTKSSNLYSSALKVKPGTIYRFRAYKSGFNASQPSAYYTDEDFSTYSFKTNIDQQLVLDLMNVERAKVAGLGAVKLDATLCKAAEVRAKEIAKKFDHERPDGTKYSALLAEYGITNIYSAENIAEGYVDAYDVMDGWIHSPNHKKNILGEHYDHVGIAVYNSDGILYWVQIFGGLDQ